MVKKKKDETTTQEQLIEKTKRTDVAERKESNKDTDFTCVKMSFNSLVENNYFRGGLQDIVLNINKICFLSYQLLNYHFTRLLAEFKSHRERRYCPHSQHVEGGINFEIEEHEEVLLGGSVDDTFGASSGSSYYGDKKILVNTQAALVQTKRI